MKFDIKKTRDLREMEIEEYLYFCDREKSTAV